MATNTAASFTNHTGNGTAGPFSISFSYLAESEVDVTVGGVLKTITTHYTFTSATQITFTSGNEPGNGVAIKFQRDTDISAKKVDFADGSVLTETDLDTQNDQVLFAQQEILDKLSGIEENATADQTDAEIRTAVENATDSNVFTDADHTKLNAIENNATADQTNAEIKTAYEANSDTNAFTDAEKTKLTSVESNATADQTAAEIRTLVESASDSNVFTDADHTKLNGIETGATADQSNAEIRAAVEAASDSNVFTDADHTKLNGIEASATADQTGAEIKSLYEGESDTNAFTDSEKTKLAGIEASATADQSNAEIKTAYEANSDTNAFTDAEKTKLSGIETSADVTDATNVDAAGAVMNSDLDGKGELLVGDGSGDPTALSVGQNGYILTADSTEATGIKWAANAGGGGGSGISNVVEDTTPQLGGNLDVQTNEITTSTTNGNVKLNPNGTGVVEVKGDGSSADGTIQLNCSQNSHGVKIKSPPHSANASYTLTLPNNDGDAGQFMKTDGSGGLSFDTVNTDLVTDTSPQLGGDLDTNSHNISLDDNHKINFGDSNDLQIFHDQAGNRGDGEFNKIESVDSHLDIQSNNSIRITYPSASNSGADTPNRMAYFSPTLQELYYSNSKKFETTSSGVTVTGTAVATTFSGSGASLTNLPAANLTGTLPAIDGSNLTGISSSSTFSSDGSFNSVAIGKGANSVSGNTVLGENALDASVSGSNNTAIGNNALTSLTSGNQNTAVGSLALDANTTAGDNTAVGYFALSGTTTGGNNTAIGHQAIRQNTTGRFNTAVGRAALDGNTTADNNTAVGYFSLSSNTTGTQNVGIGSQALQLTTTGNDNIGVGYQALKNNTTGVNNVAIGSRCLDANTDANSNTAIGHAALTKSNAAGNTAIGAAAMEENLSGTNNVAIGVISLNKNTSGANNTALGSQALHLNTTANRNTGVGSNALFANTTGGNNTAVGADALESNSTGNQNTAVGENALTACTTGSSNTGLGQDALRANTTAINNTAVGMDSLTSNTIGERNTAVGVLALSTNITANNNTAVGHSCLRLNETGGNNVAVGQSALDANSSGSNNVAIGHDALVANTTGGNNTAVGKNAGSAITTGSNNTIIGGFNGNQNSQDIRTSSNAIVISDGAGNVKFFNNGSDLYLFNISSNADGSNAGISFSGQTIQTSTTTSSQRNHHQFFNSNGEVGTIKTSGSGTSYNTSSDYRLKENVVSLSNATERLKKLNPKRFNFIADANTTLDGFLAHEVQSIVPEAISGDKDAIDEDGKIIIQGIDHSKLVPLLVATVKELETRVTALEAG